jgi:hypothetical protein
MDPNVSAAIFVRRANTAIFGTFAVGSDQTFPLNSATAVLTFVGAGLVLN